MKGASKQEKKPSSTNTGVRWVNGASGEVKDINGNTLSIESWEFSHAFFPSHKDSSISRSSDGVKTLS